MTGVKNIAIVGATGTIGRPIVAALLKTGKHEVTAITRTDSKAVMPDGVKAAKVNYDDPSTLVAALKGQQVLIVTVSPMAPKDTQSKLIEAAAEADVPYIIPNGWGVDSSHPSSDEAFLGPGQRAAQKQISELGKSSWIEFVSSFWYEYGVAGGPDRYGFDFKNQSMTFFDDGKTLVNTTTWEQTGRAVANLLSLKEKPDNESDNSLTLSSFKNRNVYISSFCVSQRDMFESVLRVTGTKEEDWKINYENSKERYQSGMGMVKQGNRMGFIKAMYVRMFYPEGQGYGSGAFQVREKLQNDVLDLPDEDFDERTKVAVQMARNSS